MGDVVGVVIAVGLGFGWVGMFGWLEFEDWRERRHRKPIIEAEHAHREWRKSRQVQHQNELRAWDEAWRRISGIEMIEAQDAKTLPAEYKTSYSARDKLMQHMKETYR